MEETTEFCDQFDFDALGAMAADDPESFEMLRLAAINKLIESAPVEKRERLRRLQWRIDQERRLARNPLNACIRISRMMWNSLSGEDGLHDRLTDLVDFIHGRKTASAARNHTTAGHNEVVSFPASAQAKDSLARHSQHRQ